MKKYAVLFLAGWTLLLAGAAGAEVDEAFATGKDWMRHMSQKEKFISLLPPSLLFGEYDVHLRHSLPQYISWIDNIMVNNPRLETEDVNNIFASAVFLLEPENRNALRNMETHFLRGDFENIPVQTPSLTTDDVLKEILPEA